MMERSARMAVQFCSLLAQGGKDHFNLFLFFQFQLADVVVQFDNSHRLDEKSGTCGGLVVYHTRNLSFVFGFDRNTVAAVAHGDNGILKIIPGTSCNQRRKLGVDPVVGGFDAAADLTKGAAGIVTDLILGKDTAADLCAEGCQRFQCRKHSVKGIGHSVSRSLLE